MSWPPHITVATVVFRQSVARPSVARQSVARPPVAREHEFLLVEEQDNNTRVFNQPAGHLEPNETLLDAAIRETLEETGWRVSLIGLVGVYQYYSAHNDTTYLRFCFAATPEQQEQTDLDPDITAAHWLSWDQIVSLPHRSPLVMTCMEDFATGKLVPLDRIQSLIPVS